MRNDRWLNGKACGRRFFNLSFVILKELKASSMVTIDKISKSYGGRPSVIADLQLSIKPHRVPVMVGTTGFGKSNFLRGLAGLERRSSGGNRGDTARGGD